MQILTPTHTDQLPPALNDTAANVMRPSQVSEYQHDLKVAEEQLKDPRTQDRGAARKRINDLRRDFETQAPRPITDGALKNKLWAEAKALAEQFRVGMLSAEEMRKNPSGSVDKHLKWERANKKNIIRYKKIMSVLNADHSPAHTWDRDAANIEKFRPASTMDRLRTDAQISGHMSYGNIAEENWAQVFGGIHPETSALNQAQRAQHITPSPEVASSDVKVAESKQKGK
jgi:hypothetical protein